MKYSVLTNSTYMVKESNTELIRNALKTLGIATRNEIARKTDLSVATCGNILKDLLETGEVFEDELDNQRGGRPARKYSYNKDFSLAICMNIHSDADQKILRYAVINLYEEILEEKTSSYTFIDMHMIDGLVCKLVEKYPAIKAFGIGIPGISNKEGAILLNDVKELNGTQLAANIKNKYDLEVSMASSPNLTAYGYYKNHIDTLEGKTFVALVAPREHLMGAGIIIDGRMYRGDTNLAGEVGYIGQCMKAITSAADENFEAGLITALISIITVLGPSTILLTGSMFTDEIIHHAEETCKKLLPAEFLPQLELKKDASEEYLNGVIHMALDSLSYKIRLIAD